MVDSKESRPSSTHSTSGLKDKRSKAIKQIHWVFTTQSFAEALTKIHVCGSSPPQCDTELKSPQGLRDFYQIKVTSVIVWHTLESVISSKIQCKMQPQGDTLSRDQRNS